VDLQDAQSSPVTPMSCGWLSVMISVCDCKVSSVIKPGVFFLKFLLMLLKKRHKEKYTRPTGPE
jgi:hypothetical protein